MSIYFKLFHCPPQPISANFQVLHYPTAGVIACLRDFPGDIYSLLQQTHDDTLGNVTEGPFGYYEKYLPWPDMIALVCLRLMIVTLCNEEGRSI